MTGNDLHRLICAIARRMTDPNKDTLARLGVHDRFLADQGEVGVANVILAQDQAPYFDFDDDGAGAAGFIPAWMKENRRNPES